MSTGISAFAPISINKDVEIEDAKNRFLQNLAEYILNTLDGDPPSDDFDFVEVALDEHLEDYYQNPDCPDTTRMMVLSLKEYLSGFIRNSDEPNYPLEVFIDSEDMEYNAFEFIVEQALQHCAFNLNEITVYGRTYSDHDLDDTNIWEDRYSLDSSGKIKVNQINGINDFD